MGAGVLPPNHLNSIKSSPSDEVKTENSQSLTEVKLSQSLPLSQDKYESVTITDASSRLLQLPTVEHDTVQLSCTCFAHTAEGEGCPRKASCTRTENVRDLAETNKKLTEQDFIFKIYSQNRVCFCIPFHFIPLAKFKCRIPSMLSGSFFLHACINCINTCVIPYF